MSSIAESNVGAFERLERESRNKLLGSICFTPVSVDSIHLKKTI